MILAAVSSGRSDLASSSLLKDERRRASTAPATVSIGAAPPSPVAAKAVVRTVMTFLASLERTV